MATPTLSTVRTVVPIPNVIHIRGSNAPAPVYHALFSLSDADFVIRSLQGTLYRIHSYTLRITSGFFESMFSLPQPKNSLISDVLDVYEDDFPLELLLKMIIGLPIPRWKSLCDLARVLALAEKWDTPGPLSIMRNALTAPQFLHDHPLSCYSLATHFDWKEEAKIASTHTLTLNLSDPSYSLILGEMSSKDVLPLLDLHQKRRNMFRELLDSPERFAAGNSSAYHCNRCGVTELDNSMWRAFKRAMFLEMERRPLGDTLGVMEGSTPDWPEALACWEAKCAKDDCRALNYDRIATLRQIRACVSLLPSTIDIQ
ncbi:hypothetical protein M413DRAFT_32470 [Hebeloma cylindrosporum]|uniref:BTB domain-containing protein n=1 Tax=Hebeloma cylindrosporum TaxID=76867 RepID=A0A0C3BTM0_HEBCY|nr:hypothetical protein M413DRAFT_32470 [Hebeloma cylindrosporum h7]